MRVKVAGEEPKVVPDEGNEVIYEDGGVKDEGQGLFCLFFLGELLSQFGVLLFQHLDVILKVLHEGYGDIVMLYAEGGQGVLGVIFKNLLQAHLHEVGHLLPLHHQDFGLAPLLAAVGRFVPTEDDGNLLLGDALGEAHIL